MKAVSQQMSAVSLNGYWVLYRQFQAERDEAQRRELRLALQRQRNVMVRTLEARLLTSLVASKEGDEVWLVWFLFNHFNVAANKAQIAVVLQSYLDVAIAGQVRGRFLDVLQAVVVHPAMLMYLDNARNLKGRGNENQARELLELHTLGVNGGYGQADVAAVAEVMTGWSVQLRGEVDQLGQTVFNASQHEGGSKRVLGHEIEASGASELQVLIQVLSQHPSSAMNLATRLCRWWVVDDPSVAMVKRVADLFRQSEGHLPTVWGEVRRLRQELEPPLGTAPLRPGKFKEPLRYVVSATRLLLGHGSLQQAQPLVRWMRLLGQPLLGRTTPDGYPLRGMDWLNSGQLAQRIELAREMVAAVPKLLGTDVPSDVQRQMPFDTERAQALRGRLSTASRATIERANSPAEAWGLLLACPEFMYL